VLIRLIRGQKSGFLGQDNRWKRAWAGWFYSRLLASIRGCLPELIPARPALRACGGCSGIWSVLTLDPDGHKKRKGGGPVTFALRCAYRRAGGFNGGRFFCDFLRLNFGYDRAEFSREGTRRESSRSEFNHGFHGWIRINTEGSVLIRAYPFNPWSKIGVSFRLFFKGRGYYLDVN
jgi:hypothetical protein